MFLGQTPGTDHHLAPVLDPRMGLQVRLRHLAHPDTQLGWITLSAQQSVYDQRLGQTGIAGKETVADPLKSTDPALRVRIQEGNPLRPN